MQRSRCHRGRPSRESSLLQSSGLRRPPKGYTVYRVIPKPFWRFWGQDYKEEVPLDARPVGAGAPDPGGLYRSDPLWKIPPPLTQTGQCEFMARTNDQAGYSGVLTSARMWLEELDRSTVTQLQIDALIAKGAIVKAKFGVATNKVLVYRVRSPVDPPVTIRVLQGSEVLEYLLNTQGELADIIGVAANTSFDRMPGSDGLFQ